MLLLQNAVTDNSKGQKKCEKKKDRDRIQNINSRIVYFLISKKEKGNSVTVIIISLL